MKKCLFFVVLMFATAFSAFAQIEDEVVNYQPKTELMMKARGLIEEKLKEGDFSKVKKIKDYALTLTGENINPFSRSELWSIMFLTNEFEALGNDIAAVNNDNYYMRSVWFRDALEEVLNKALKEFDLELKEQLKSATVDAETMNVLRLTLDWLENGAGRTITSDMHNHAVAHLAVNPDSRYKWFIERRLMMESLSTLPNSTSIAPSFRHRNVWSIGYVASLGGGLFARDLGDSYKGFGSFGFELVGAFNRFALNIGINFMPTYREIKGDVGSLEKGTGATVFMPKGSLGYYLIQKDKFRMKPYVGVAGLLFRHPSAPYEIDFSDLDFNLLAYCGGCSFDFKFRSGPNGYELLNINYLFGVSHCNGANGIGTVHMISVGYSMEALFYGRY